MKIHFRIWMQDNAEIPGKLVDHPMDDISPEMSFLEALDHVNAKRIAAKQRVIEFDHDCREGICGTCGLVINGNPHGPFQATTTCQLHMRSFQDGDTITVEPFRAKAFRIIRDLKVDRTALDRIIESGGFISTNIRTAPEANSILISKQSAASAFDAASCIGCGACVAICKNSAASLFTAAKISHLEQLPHGQIEKESRVVSMVKTMDEEEFGSCTNTEACEAVCPQEISADNIARMNFSYNWARLKRLGKLGKQ